MTKPNNNKAETHFHVYWNNDSVKRILLKGKKKITNRDGANDNGVETSSNPQLNMHMHVCDPKVLMLRWIMRIGQLIVLQNIIAELNRSSH